MSLDRSHLQLLVALLEHGRLADAARSLHLSASAASHRLAEAERRLGITLTEHHGRTLRLTEAGRHLATVGRDVEFDLDRAELIARYMGGPEPLRVRVAVGFHDTVDWYTSTFEPPPEGARLELLRLVDDQLVQAVRSNTADLAVAPWPKPPSGLRNVTLWDDELVAVVAANSELADTNRIAPADLAGHTFLTSSYQPRGGFEFHDFFLPSGEVPHNVVLVQSLETLLRLIGEGHGYSIQPAAAVTWNRPTPELAIVPLAGRSIRVRWTALHRLDADEATHNSALRIAAAFEAAIG